MKGRNRSRHNRTTRYLHLAEQETQRRVRDGELSMDAKVYESGTSLYCPHKPSIQQQKFLDCQSREVLYGGAAGGGKTDALLMDVLDGVMNPKYSALILRRSFARLKLPGSIMDRAREWLSKYPEVTFNASDHKFTFPSGAVITFGYLDVLSDRYQYMSAEYQFIGWDELTEFNLRSSEDNPYLFMLSRLRKTADMTVRLKMRAATNPGSEGHIWVKNRFITPDCQKALEKGSHDTIYVGGNEEEVKDKIRAFIPAKIDDNVALNAEEYKKNLEELPPIVRARLLHGDWTVQESSLFEPDKFRYYHTRSDYHEIESDSKAEKAHIAACMRFATVDTAGTTPPEIKKGSDNSCWSAMGVWDYYRELDWLFLVYMWRNREGFTDLCRGITRKAQAWDVGTVYIEKAHFGDAVHNVLQRDHSVRSELLSTMKFPKGFEKTDPAKVKRATAALNRMDKGRMFFPREASWMPDYEAELMSWTGDPTEDADQVDVTSYAAMLVAKSVPVQMALSALSGESMFEDLVPEYMDGGDNIAEMDPFQMVIDGDGDSFIGMN